MPALKVHGSDLSRWNPNPDLKRAKSAGLLFLYHKATEGATVIDPTFKSRRAAASEANMPFGAYHFARPDRDGRDAVREAKVFMAVANPQAGDLVPCLDFEVDDLGTEDRALKWIKEFLAEVERNLKSRNLNGKPLVYIPIKFRFSRTELPYPRWVPRYNLDNRRPDTPWDIHQFSAGSDGKGNPSTFPGVGFVDLNNFRDGFTLSDIRLTKAGKPKSKPKPKPTAPVVTAPKPNTPTKPVEKPKSKSFTFNLGLANIKFPLNSQQVADDTALINKHAGVILFQEIMQPSDLEGVMKGLRKNMDLGRRISENEENAPRKRSVQIAWNRNRFELIDQFVRPMPGFDPQTDRKKRMPASQQRCINVTTLNPFTSVLPYMTFIDLHLIPGAFGNDKAYNTPIRKEFWMQQFMFIQAEIEVQLAMGRIVFVGGDWNRQIWQHPTLHPNATRIMPEGRTGIDAAYMVLPDLANLKTTISNIAAHKGHTDHMMRSCKVKMEVAS